MKFEQYERPELEEIELLLEGSFEDTPSGGEDPNNPGLGKDPEESEGDNWN